MLCPKENKTLTLFNDLLNLAPTIHLTFTWCSPDHHLTFPWPSPDPYLTFKLHLTFTWHSLIFTWHSPDHHLTFPWTLISSFQLKKIVWWWVVDQPITDPISGLVLTLHFTFDPELDKNLPRTSHSIKSAIRIL